MKNQKNNSFSCEKNQSQSHSQVEYSSSKQKIENLSGVYEETASFYEVFEKVKRQIEFKSFDVHTRDAAEDICLIITEVLKLPPNTLIRIAGDNLPAEMVQAVYHRLSTNILSLLLRITGGRRMKLNTKRPISAQRCIIPFLNLTHISRTQLIKIFPN